MICYTANVTQDEAATHWHQRALAELKVAKFLFEKQDLDLYGDVLFHCHLALELALKAQYIREKDAAAPFTHDLGELAKALGEIWNVQEREDFDEITDVGILSRYGDAQWYATHATKEKTAGCLRKTEQLFSKLDV